MNEVEASSTGLYDLKNQCWDGDLCDFISGRCRPSSCGRSRSGDQNKEKNPDERREESPRRRLVEMLGSKVIKRTDCNLGNVGVSQYLCDRYDFQEGCQVTLPLPSVLTSYLSFLPSRKEVGISFSDSDHCLVPMEGMETLPLRPSIGETILPRSRSASDGVRVVVNPLFYFASPRDGSRQPGGQFMPFLALGQYYKASEARTTLKESSANGRWSVYHQLVKMVPIGGSATMDDKVSWLLACRT
ncbi:hypothetical protein IE53DRAFT_65964 [Violaceomyces palustris]|uniref:Uncharacterized protein n=1 Tax=Violaceomyces palustris TaxID=1673888 RepID=A0ACD0NYX8_9BASI|nr:hypothetical protein IE53DRAFT_65964 [Violaceomyces palustris]